MKSKISTRKFLRNFSSLLIGKTLGDLFTFLFFVVISRTFGQDGIGKYSFAIALTGFFVVFADFGLGSLSTKEMSRRTDSLCEYFSKIIILRIILASAVLAVMFAVLPFLSFPRETIIIIAIIGVYQIIYSLVDGFSTVFIAREDMHLVGLIEFSIKMASGLLSILVIKLGGGLVMSLGVLPIVSFVCLIVTYFIIVKKYGKLRFILSLSSFTRLLREAVPYGLSILCRQLATRIDIIFIGFLIGASAAGVYNVGYRVVFLLFVVPVFTGTALFPIASRFYVNSQEELIKMYHKSLNLGCLIGVPVATGLWLVAPEVVGLVFGKDFLESALILRYLTWLLLLAFFKSIMGVFLTSCDQQMDRTKGQMVAVCSNVFGNAILIPALGIKGAAIATLFSETLLVIFFAMRLKKVLGWPKIWIRLAMSSVATVSFVSPLLFYKTQSLFITIPVAVFIYMGVLLFFKEIRRNELQILVNLFKSGFRKEVLTG